LVGLPKRRVVREHPTMNCSSSLSCHGYNLWSRLTNYNNQCSLRYGRDYSSANISISSCTLTWHQSGVPI